MRTNPCCGIPRQFSQDESEARYVAATQLQTLYFRKQPAARQRRQLLQVLLDPFVWGLIPCHRE
jgi:hypothetical protein